MRGKVTRQTLVWVPVLFMGPMTSAQKENLIFFPHVFFFIVVKFT